MTNRASGTPKARLIELTALVIAALMFVVCFRADAALFSDNLRGNLSITGVSSNTDDISTKSLNQQYSFHWSKKMLSHLELRASMRYYDLDVDQSLGQNSWRTEYQPAGELIWKHPNYLISGNARRQKSSTSGGTVDLYRDNIGLMFATRMITYPILSVRYDLSRTYNDTEISGRDTRERLLRSSLDYNFRNNHLYYGLTLRNNDNRFSDLVIDEVRHLARWQQSTDFFGERVSIGTGYTFNHYSQTTELAVDGKSLTLIPISTALYAHDPSPDVGELDTLSSLGDGNTETPAFPTIDLGDARPDHNLGIAFDFERDVSAIYVYTDRPSSSLLNWRVFVSTDNLTWEPTGTATSVAYNTSFNRYEIIFTPLSTRYIKAVNSGINDVQTVFVTEIEALLTSTDQDKGTRTQAYHLVDLNTRFRFSNSLQSSFDISYRKESRGDLRERQDRIYYAFSTKHTPTAAIRQIVGFTSGSEEFVTTGTTNRNDNLTYVLLLTPLQTLQFTISGASRTGYIDHVRTLETNNLLFQVSGSVLPTLKMTSSASYTRDNRFDTFNMFDTWTYRASIDANLRRSLDVGFSYLRQTTDDLNLGGARLRRMYGGNFDFRATSSILMRGSVSVNDDNGLRYVFQEYNFSWSVTRKLTFGALATFADGNSGVLSERNNLRMSYLISKRSTLFLSLSQNSSGLSDLPETTSIQAGLKTGF
ncbi:MAG: hypothetical protein KKG33_11955 [candidate division Zixibacteria bacterium]|nr:hypothetical protein [candidate division Zixibacteria bacterium]MBU1471383.1 hypothetical protein [candidate division Zixibacteria bacterium]MBU2626262.1 hypothetical protein [candidate division Zixibacteria bacterium]